MNEIAFGIETDPELAQPNKPERSVVIGYKSVCTHEDCVIIGIEISSDHDHQLKIGNEEVTLSRKMTDEEFKSLYEILHHLLSWRIKP